MPLNVEQTSECPVCHSAFQEAVMSDLDDRVLGAVDYSGQIRRCSDCGHTFLCPVLSPENLHLAYEGYYTQRTDNLESSTHARHDLFTVFKPYYLYRYKGVFSTRGWLVWAASRVVPFAGFFLRRAVRFLDRPSKKRAPESHAPRLLDVGCGSGDFLMRAECCGYESTGIDIDASAIQIARARGLNAHVAQLHELPGKGAYDVITLSHVIEHVRDPVQLVKDISEKLKLGGYLYLSTPNYDSAGRKTFGEHWRGLDVPRHMQFFHVQLARKILENEGFTVEQVYDLPQSLQIIRSSYRLKYPSGTTLSELLRSTAFLLRNGMQSKERLDVIVFKCFKPARHG